MLAVAVKDHRHELIATCKRGGRRYDIALLDIEVRADPATSRLIAAYRRWLGYGALNNYHCERSTQEIRSPFSGLLEQFDDRGTLVHPPSEYHPRFAGHLAEDDTVTRYMSLPDGIRCRTKGNRLAKTLHDGGGTGRTRQHWSWQPRPTTS